MTGALAAALDHYEALYERSDNVTGVASGFGELDKILGDEQISS
jgi:replicative DNA helicase